MALSHVNQAGNLQMVDVGDKADSVRTATASARVLLGQEAFELVQNNQMKKGDVLTVAQIAGIQGAKQTANLIPLCHTLLLQKIELTLRLNPEVFSVEIESHVRCSGQTGVEMEALTAVSVAALTVYDMCKAVNKGIEIQDIRLLSKSGGKSDFKR
jgi:molybdenum cofactor biosynthesis protein MoaC